MLFSSPEKVYGYSNFHGFFDTGIQFYAFTNYLPETHLFPDSMSVSFYFSSRTGSPPQFVVNSDHLHYLAMNFSNKLYTLPIAILKMGEVGKKIKNSDDFLESARELLN